MKLIDKDALIAEIERLERENKQSEYVYNSLDTEYTLKNILSFINTLEVKEVDLKKEIDTYFNNYEIASKEDCYLTHEQACAFAKHFFELGLKAQKGE